MAGPGVVIGKVSVKVTPDTSRFRRSLQAQLTKIEKSLRPITVHVGVEVDDDSLRNFRRRLNDLIDDYDGEDISLAPGVAEAAYRHTQARLALLSRPRRVELFPTVNKAAAAKATASLTALSGLRVLNTYLQRTINLLGNLDRNIPMITMMSNALAVLGAWGLTAASNLFALSYSLAQIGGAALALPGIFAGIAVGVGATIAVLKDAGEILSDVGDQISQLQDDMSARFWSEAEAPIRRMIDTLFPELRAGLMETSAALANYFSGLADGLREALGGQLQGMFDNLNRSINIAARGTEALAGIIETLGTTGSEYLPRLAQWFVRISNQFNNWLDAAEADGRLQGWIDAGIQALADLGRVLYETGRILTGVFSAAVEAGGSTLGILADTLGRVADVVNGEPFRSKLVAVFEAAHEAMSLLADNAGPGVTAFFEALADVLTTVLPLVGETVGALIGGIGDALSQTSVTGAFEQMFKGMADGINALLPVLPIVGQALGAIMLVIGNLAANLGPVLAPALEAFAQAIIAMTPAIQAFADILSGALTALFDTLGPEALGFLIVTIGTLVGSIKIWTAAQKALNVAMTMNPIGRVIVLIAALVAGFIYLWNTSEGFRSFWIALWEGIKVIVSTAVTVVKALFSGLMNGIKNIFQGAFDVIMGIWNIFAGIFTGDWSRVWNGIKQLVSGIWNVIKGAFQVFINIGILKVARLGLGLVRGAFGSIWNGIKGLLSGIWNGIKGIFSGFMNALKSLASGALNAIKSLFSGAWNGVKSLTSGAVNGIKNLWSSGMSALKNAISSAINGIKNLFSGLKDSVLGFFSNAGSWLYDSGKSIIQGFGDGLKSAMGSVRDSVGGFLSGIRDKFPFSPAKEGPFSGKGWVYYSGISIAEGLADGIRAAQGDAKRAADMLSRAAYPNMPDIQPATYDYDDSASARNITVYQNNHYPQAQPAAQQVNDALQTAAALGL